MPEGQPKIADWAEFKKAPVEKKSLQQTIDEAKKDWVITKTEVQDIMDRFDEEKDDLTDDTKIKVADLHKDIWTKMLKDWIKVEWWSTRLINRILEKLSRKPIDIDSFSKELKDKDFVVTDSEQQWKLVVYEAWIMWKRLWFIEVDWEFTPDSWLFDRNKEWNDDQAEDDKKEIKIEKKTAEKPKAEEVKPEPKAEKTKPAESVKIDKTSLETKWIKPYTKKNYSKYFEDINKLDFSKVKNTDEKEKIKNALQNPSKENVETLQKIVGAKKIDKPQIDGKFWDNTMKALQTYIASESVKPGEWEKAAATTVSRSMDANSQNIADAKKPEWKPEEKKPEPKDDKQPKLRKDTKAEGSTNTPTSGTTPKTESTPTAIAEKSKDKAPVQEAKAESTREAPKA